MFHGHGTGKEIGWSYEGNMGGADGAGNAFDPNTGFALETFLCGAQGILLIALNPIARFP